MLWNLPLYELSNENFSQTQIHLKNSFLECYMIINFQWIFSHSTYTDFSPIPWRMMAERGTTRKIIHLAPICLADGPNRVEDEGIELLTWHVAIWEATLYPGEYKLIHSSKCQAPLREGRRQQRSAAWQRHMAAKNAIFHNYCSY